MGIDLREVEFEGTLMDYFTQEYKIEKLIEVLRAIEKSNTLVKTDDDVIHGILGDNIEIAMIYSLAEELLITEQGQCNWVNINKLKKKGYDVFAGHQDNTGWLTGCIKTKRGILVYG